MALWVEIKQLQQTMPAPAAVEITTVPELPSRFSPGQTIVDEAANTPLCTVKQSVGQGAFGEVYQVVWTGIGADRGTTLAMKAVRLADVKLDERDAYRIILLEEILTVSDMSPEAAKRKTSNTTPLDSPNQHRSCAVLSEICAIT